MSNTATTTAKRHRPVRFTFALLPILLGLVWMHSGTVWLFTDEPMSVSSLRPHHPVCEQALEYMAADRVRAERAAYVCNMVDSRNVALASAILESE